MTAVVESVAPLHGSQEDAQNVLVTALATEYLETLQGVRLNSAAIVAGRLATAEVAYEEARQTVRVTANAEKVTIEAAFDKANNDAATQREHEIAAAEMKYSQTIEEATTTRDVELASLDERLTTQLIQIPSAEEVVVSEEALADAIIGFVYTSVLDEALTAKIADVERLAQEVAVLSTEIEIAIGASPDQLDADWRDALEENTLLRIKEVQADNNISAQKKNAAITRLNVELAKQLLAARSARGKIADYAEKRKQLDERTNNLGLIINALRTNDMQQSSELIGHNLHEAIEAIGPNTVQDAADYHKTVIEAATDGTN